jgi:hypothetical protein
MNNIYNKDWFKTTFLDVNFDNLLIEVDNHLVNSNEFYLEYKNKYLSITHENFETFNKLLDNFNSLHNNYSVNNNKYIYTFIDNDEYEKLKYELKILVDSQRQAFKNFIQYIEFLNTSH